MNKEFIWVGLFFFPKRQTFCNMLFLLTTVNNFQHHARFILLLASFRTHAIFSFMLLTSSTKAQPDALNRLFRTYYVVLSGMRHCFCNNYSSERDGSSPCTAAAWDSTEAVNLKIKNFSWLTLLSQHSPNSSDWRKKKYRKNPLPPQESILHQSSKFTLISGGSLNSSSWQI